MRPPTAQIYAHEAALKRLSGGGASAPVASWPSDTFFTAKHTLYFNGDPIELLHQPAAHTDGDIMVWFRKNDVIAAGDVFTPDRFPMIDLARGGSVQGMLDALNTLIDLTIPRYNQQGGTMVIPGHGRIANESDVVEYRDMATIVRDRIRRMIDRRMSLDEVLAANPVRDYEGIYDRAREWTKEMFVEAVYRDLSRR
jgi:glyoxylase-like metal-dependent hydrolase (beta-lactamase superfamily II)